MSEDGLICYKGLRKLVFLATAVTLDIPVIYDNNIYLQVGERSNKC